MEGEENHWWIDRSGGVVQLMTRMGAFSVHDPSHLFTGRGWDAQSVCLLLGRAAPRDLLLLGLGGATAGRQCRALFPDAKIVGVEVDARIIAVAQREFNVGASGITIVHDSAENFLRRGRRRFDAIVDDAWPLAAPRPRAALDDPGWIERCRSRLRSGGLLAVNLYAREALPKDHRHVVRGLREVFAHVREVRVPGRLTTVVVGGDDLRDGREMWQAMRQRVAPLAGPPDGLRFRSL